MRFSTGSLLVAGCCLASSCGLNQQGVPPNPDAIAFPSSALVDASGRWLFVVNGNSDLRYNDGTLVVVNVGAAGADRPSAGAPQAPFADCPTVNYVQAYHANDSPAV